MHAGGLKPGVCGSRGVDPPAAQLARHPLDLLALAHNGPGALAVERSGDFLALAGLFAVSVSGLFLTVSSTWLDGRYYSALNTIHALTVILGLMYIPFGKLFHIFQRPANLGVQYYKRANVEGEQANIGRQQ